MVRSNLKLRYNNKSSEFSNNSIRLLFEMTQSESDELGEQVKRGKVLADLKKVKLRMEFCGKCKSFDKNLCMCALCGCGIKMKVRLENSSCPVSIW
jgi:hypothetical protein